MVILVGNARSMRRKTKYTNLQTFIGGYRGI
jgi:hypothetical protein